MSDDEWEREPEAEDPGKTNEQKVADAKRALQSMKTAIESIPDRQRTPHQRELLAALTATLESLNSKIIKEVLSGTKAETEEAPSEKKEEKEGNPEGGRRKRKSRRSRRARKSRTTRRR